MLKYDIIIRTTRGNLQATLEAEPGIPTGLLLQAVMSHQQLVPLLVDLGVNEATTLLISTPSRLTAPPGLTVAFTDGVTVSGPMKPSPVVGVPDRFRGITLTHNLAAVVTYVVGQ